MADYRRYQPRRNSSQGGGWGRWFVIGGVIVLIIIIIRWTTGGKNTSSDTSSAGKNTHSGISLITDNSNTVITNTATSSVTTVSSWDGFSTQSCLNAISSFGTAKRVVLTIGFSAANDSIAKVLDSLQQAGVPADLFVSGSFAEKNPEVVKVVSQAGRAVYSQSYDSTDLTTLSDENLTSAVTKTETAIVAATGRSPKPVIRPPAGSYTAATTKLLRQLGYCSVLWTVDAYDWQDGMTVKQSKERVMTSVTKHNGGAIVALHAGYDITPQLITDLVSDLKAQGYQLVTLATLLTT